MYQRPLNGRNNIPPEWNTISRWRGGGYRVRPNARPRGYAMIGMAWGGRARFCPLYALEDCVPIRRRRNRRKAWEDPVFKELDRLLEQI